MPKYFTTVDRWLSHESRTVKADTEFETEFPLGPKGEPMRLSDTLTLVTEPEAKPAKAPKSDNLV